MASSSPPTGDFEALAPLASMEDLSVIATPMTTPGASPRTRARWSQHRASTGSQGLVGLDDDMLSVPADGCEPLLTSTPNAKARPLEQVPDGAHRRFASPAKAQNALLRQALDPQPGQGLVQPAYTLPSNATNGSRNNYPRVLLRPPPSRSFARSCDPIAENPDQPIIQTAPLNGGGPSRRPARRAWRPNGYDEDSPHHLFAAADPEERVRILDPERDELLGSPRHVQFLATPRRTCSEFMAAEGVASGPVRPAHAGYRVGATEEVVFGGTGTPKDRFNLIYIVLVLHGVGTLMPWNMFITAKEYFVNYKLGEEYTKAEFPYSTYFLQYIAFAAQVPNVIFNWINVFLNVSGTLTSRIVWTLFIEVVIFVVTIILAMIDSSGWPGIFFYLTIFSVIILNMVNGMYQNTIYGLAAKLPFKYTGAVVLGSNLSGTIVAIINLISISLAPNPRTAAIYYFITALFILLACFDTYFALPLNRFFRYHTHMYREALHAKKKQNVIHAIPYWTVFKQCFPQCFNVFFTFCVTLTIFPAVYAEIFQVDRNFIVPSAYYSALTCFLTFNVAAVIGNILPSIYRWPSPEYLFVPILLRALFIPFFLLCNYRPSGIERLWPVLIHWDYAYWVAGALLGLTSGYFSSMAMMFCPRSVEPEYSSTAGMLGASSIVTGIFAGIGLSYLMPILVSHPALNFEEPSWWPHYTG